MEFSKMRQTDSNFIWTQSCSYGIYFRDALTVLRDLLNVGAACLYEGIEVPWDRAVVLCFAI